VIPSLLIPGIKARVMKVPMTKNWLKLSEIRLLRRGERSAKSMAMAAMMLAYGFSGISMSRMRKPMTIDGKSIKVNLIKTRHSSRKNSFFKRKIINGKSMEKNAKEVPKCMIADSVFPGIRPNFSENRRMCMDELSGKASKNPCKKIKVKFLPKFAVKKGAKMAEIEDIKKV